MIVNGTGGRVAPPQRVSSRRNSGPWLCRAAPSDARIAGSVASPRHPGTRSARRHPVQACFHPFLLGTSFLDTAQTSRPAPPTLGASLKYWLKLGFISFGGPAADARALQLAQACAQARCLHADLAGRDGATADGRHAVCSGAIDAFPGIVAVAAFIALWKYKADIMLVIGVCALLGPAYLFFM